jgi:hypothetical protein
MDQINLENAEAHRDDNEEVLQAWIDQILDGTITLDGKTFLFQQVANKQLRRDRQL